MQLTGPYECKAYGYAVVMFTFRRSRNLISRVCYSFSFFFSCCCCVSSSITRQPVFHMMREWPQFYSRTPIHQYFDPSSHLCRRVRRSAIPEMCDITWVYPLCICDSTSHIHHIPISDGQMRETRRILRRGFQRAITPKGKGRASHSRDRW